MQCPVPAIGWCGRADERSGWGRDTPDWRGLTGRAPNADVVLEADAAEFGRRLVGRIASLAAASAARVRLTGSQP